MKAENLSKLGAALIRIRRTNIQLGGKQDISIAELNTMVMLVNNRTDSQENVFASSIAQQLHISKAALSQMTSSLEKRGFLLRDFNQSNRRQIVLTLTPKGQEAVMEAQEEFFKLMERLVSGLGEEKAVHLTRLLDELSDLLTNIAKETE